MTPPTVQEKLPRRLPMGASKEERLAHHKKRMVLRRERYERTRGDAFFAKQLRPKREGGGGRKIIANLSRRHPLYGLSPVEHDRAKRL